VPSLRGSLNERNVPGNSATAGAEADRGVRAAALSSISSGCVVTQYVVRLSGSTVKWTREAHTGRWCAGSE